MSRQQHIRNRIAAFMSGEMSKEEESEFKQELDKDPELNTILAEETVKHGERIELKNRLENIRLDIENKPLVKPMFSIYKIAATIALLIGTAGLFWMVWPSQSINNLELFEESFIAYRGLPVERGISNTSGTYAMDAYRNRKYMQAINGFNALDTANGIQYFYLGLSYLAVDPPNFESAIVALNKVLLTDNDYHSIAEWYLALAYLGDSKVEEAKIRLESIVNSDDAYNKSEAVSLLEKL